MKIRNKDREAKPDKGKKKRVPVIRTGTHKKSVVALWLVLIAGISFGTYKNFTAIDRHTVHESKTIELRLHDTSSLENFVREFAKVYYTWDNTKESIDSRTTALDDYLTDGLQSLNEDTVRSDIPTSSTVADIRIWSIEDTGTDGYDVVYEVVQNITTGKEQSQVTSCFSVRVHVDAEGDMVIIQNPTITSKPKKSAYEPQRIEADGTVDTQTAEEVSEFLETFFKLYPSASEKELSYYVRDGVLSPVSRDYLFSSLVNPVYSMKDGQVKVSVFVKFLDQQTKATQISQYDLTLTKDTNWKIIG